VLRRWRAAHALAPQIIVVDWNSQVPLRCNPRYRRLLPNVPFHCTGAYNDRSCTNDVLRLIEVPPDMANRYAPNSSVSEVHTFNMAVTRARGKIVLRIDQDTFVRGSFFRWELPLSLSCRSTACLGVCVE
jgi:hypothetical protein